MTRTRSLFLSLLAGLSGAVMFLQPVPDAQAQDTTAGPVLATAPPSAWSTVVLPRLVSFALDPMVWSLAAGLFMLWLRTKNAARAAQVEKAIDTAFGIVEDMKKAGKLPDGAAKADVALGKLHEILTTQGIKATDVEIELAKQAWSAAHGTQVAPPVVAPAVPAPVPAP